MDELEAMHVIEMREGDALTRVVAVDTRLGMECVLKAERMD